MKRLGLGLALSLIAKAALAVTIYLAPGDTFVVPLDWSNGHNSIEIVGTGANGATNPSDPTSAIGGGGGAYAKITNLILTPGASIPTFQTATNCNPANGTKGVIWFKDATTVLAECGATGGNSGSPGQGGLAANSVGTTKFSGGNGAHGTGSGIGLGGGGGAAGPHGNGGNGVFDGAGGAGDAGFGGAGGVPNAGAGGNGTEWDATHGSGGGGGGSSGISTPASGGLYGAGGTFGGGRPGLIVIQYEPRHRVSSGVF